jgi:hypothetical protein
MERRIDPLSVTSCRAAHDRDQHHDCQITLRGQDLPPTIAIKLALILSMTSCSLTLSMTLAATFELLCIASLTDARITLWASTEHHDLLRCQ